MDNRLTKHAKGVIAECKRLTFPSKQKTLRVTAFVMAVSVAGGIVLGSFHAVLEQLMGYIFF